MYEYIYVQRVCESSLCARRSSVHERRGSISVKDARDEALRLRQSIAQPDDEDDDDDDDDDDGGQVLNAITVTAPPIVVVQVNNSPPDVTPVVR